MKKIGLFGGTFNPIHIGHIALASNAYLRHSLDVVYFIPAGNPYMKDPRALAPYEDRCKMVEMAIQHHDWAQISKLECDTEEPSCTSVTLRRAKELYGKENEYYIILGEDAYEQLDQWYDYEYILNNSHIIVGCRGKDKINEKYGYTYTFTYIKMDCPFSSSTIRDLINHHGAWDYMVNPDVATYIRSNCLYDYPAFNAQAERANVVDWIRNKMNGFGENSVAVIGISGGKDSSVAAALCVEALGKDRVVGVTMPDGAQSDIEDSYELCNILGIRRININIELLTNTAKLLVEHGMNLKIPTVSSVVNMPARMRMTMLYMVAQNFPCGFVINTCNLSEDWIGYSTWHGDSAGDFSPLARFTSEEVSMLGDACGLPEHLTHKTPSDGLSGYTDEENLGFTYKELNEYIRTGIITNMGNKEKIDKRHKANLFKLQPLDYYDYKGPIKAEGA